LNKDTLDDVIANTKGMVGQANISITQSRNLTIPVPSKQEQYEIVSILDEFCEREEKAQELYDVIGKIESMKKAVLSQAFRGALGTNVPSELCSTELIISLSPLPTPTPIPTPIPTTIPTPTQIPMVAVPNLNGLSRSAAESELTLNGLIVGTIAQPYNYNILYNTVFEQSISSGTQVISGTTINFLISNGAKSISVGDYVYFDGGRLYLNSTGSDGRDKPNSTDTGLFIISDPLTNGRYGVKYAGTTLTRYGWADASLIHQQTN
jgi:hypothetical protein